MPYPMPLRGHSPAITSFREKLEAAARTEFPVLLLGEPGTGKQAAAVWLTARSKRSDKVFLEANTACWNGNATLHSALFGHERGAFTGASQRYPGLFERADQGTLFLDEIGEVDPGIQAMLLKTLDQGVIEPLGSKTARKVDVRLIAATNRDLYRAVEQGLFRADLLSRIDVLSLTLPAILERGADWPELWDGYAARHRVQVSWPGERVVAEELQAARGNLRALERMVIQRSVWGANGGRLQID